MFIIYERILSLPSLPEFDDDGKKVGEWVDGLGGLTLVVCFKDW